jgi:exopolysaccharide biosynthesis polyprenyl glycosylphosphotransferase
MLKEKDAVIRKLMMAADASVISAAFFVSYILRTQIHAFYRIDLFPSRNVISSTSGSFSEYLVILLIIAPLWCFFLIRNGMYRSWRLRTARHMIWIIFKATILTAFVAGATFFLSKITFVSRLFFMTFVMIGFLGLVVEKSVLFGIMHGIRKRGYNYRQILIIGTGPRADRFIHKILHHPEWGLRILGAIEDEAGRGVERVGGIEVIGNLSEISGILHQIAIDEVVVVVPRLRLDHVKKAIRDCEIEGVKVTIAVDLFDMLIAKAHQSELDGIPLLSFSTTVPSEWQLFLKRAMDVSVSGFLIIVLSPILLEIMLLIKLTSPGPAFFKQERIGLNKRRFIMYKFRTMFHGVHKSLVKVDIYKEIYETEWKKKKLKYMTPIGKLLRKFSLDELPQLFNVFLGHMSLVGPRPTLPEEVEQYQTWFRRRFSMRPGLTCLWQVSGRRTIQLNEWMEMDLEYLDHWSLWLDIKILLKTIPVVFIGRGAY